MNRKRVPLRSLFFTLVAVSFLVSQVGAGQEQTPSKPQAWDAGTRYPDWEAPSTLEIVNECKKEHSFSVTKKDADFLDFQFTQPIRVPGRKSVTVPVRFHTDGMTPGIYSGLVTILCTDCTEVPPCMQDRKTIAPRIRVLPRQPPAGSEPASTSPGKTTQPAAPTGKPGDQPSAQEKPPTTPSPTTPPTKPVDNPSTQEKPPAKPGDQPSTQEKPPTTPNTVEVKKGCCCCVDGLELRLKSHARPFPGHKEVVWKRDENGGSLNPARNQATAFSSGWRKAITRPGPISMRGLRWTSGTTSAI